MAALTRSEHTTYCPYKGDASYYSITAGAVHSLNAVWTYETPFGDDGAGLRTTSPSIPTASTRSADLTRQGIPILDLQGEGLTQINAWPVMACP